ncbi:uncharacterized protein LOC125720607 isoform X5 [Brienomyrus brachyistius]|uniref:uncharacterized protein LOC125720607 isoform X4 n=1 Tax=Brienomyrus brachyistius TaxID=42636 RepID=UPI0020B3A3D7|nr:uncharacterized protein LOC125720607 isoform X4 [Brienomyrus brachyistius]XP_048852149.1 uncharacterized protein LOC125720607 isoform X5 [Brienomyrus brachyistius]
MWHCILLILFLHLILHVSSNSAFTLRTVDVKSTITLPCIGSISKDKKHDVRWEIENLVAHQNILVAHYQQGKLTAGEWFKGRVSISEDDIGVGNFSLKISPVEYSDGDFYMCFWGEERIGDVKLEVLVPTKVVARLGETATLPCYFQVDKTEKINNDSPHWMKDGQICGHWNKDGQTVLDFPSGSFNKSCGCENRCSMSVDRFRFGDLSLTISQVRYSDRGTYQCFSTEKTEKTVNPDAIILAIEGTTEPMVPTTEDPPAPAGNIWPWVIVVVLLVVVVVLLVLVVKMRLKRCAFCDQRQPFLQCRMRNLPVSQEDTQPQIEIRSLVSPQPVQENGQDKQLRAPVCESGDTEDKRGPQPWNDDFCM